MKITDIEGFPKSLLKKKHVELYKAFVVEDPDKELNVDTSIDMLAITKEAAVNEFVNENKDFLNDFTDSIFDKDGKPYIISLVIFKMDKDDLLSKELVLPEGTDVVFEHDIIPITLKNKIYKIEVKDMRLMSISIDIDNKTERRICSCIELADV